jgi:hypothetical protein
MDTKKRILVHEENTKGQPAIRSMIATDENYYELRTQPVVALTIKTPSGKIYKMLAPLRRVWLFVTSPGFIEQNEEALEVFISYWEEKRERWLKAEAKSVEECLEQRPFSHADLTAALYAQDKHMVTAPMGQGLMVIDYTCNKIVSHIFPSCFNIRFSECKLHEVDGEEILPPAPYTANALTKHYEAGRIRGYGEVYTSDTEKLKSVKLRRIPKRIKTGLELVQWAQKFQENKNKKEVFQNTYSFLLDTTPWVISDYMIPICTQVGLQESVQELIPLTEKDLQGWEDYSVGEEYWV